MNIKHVILYLFLFSYMSFVFADDESDPCKAEGGGAQAASMCLEKDLKNSDSELNNTYQAAIKRIQDEERFMGRDLENLFRKSQRAWLTFRDSYCEFEGESTGAAGGWSGVHMENCILEMNLKRIEYFKKVFWG